MAVAFTGKSPSDALLAAPDPQAQVETLLSSPDFYERYASFINRSFLKSAGPDPQSEAPYWLSLRILNENKPWKDLFLGPYNVSADQNGKVTAGDDPKGLGYFRSDAWMRKHAGGEAAGIRLTTAARIIQNVVGLKLEAAPAKPDQDRSAVGREAPDCRGCHFDSWFALDRVASVLSRRVGTGADLTFGAQPSPSAQAFDGVTITSDKDIVTTLTSSEQFLFHQCSLAFTFLYGRSENACEGAAVDKCMNALKSTGSIKSGLAEIVKDPAFCD